MKKITFTVVIMFFFLLAFSGVAGAQDSPVPVESVTLSLTSMELTVDDFDYLRATVNPSSATNRNLEWASSNPNVATVVATTSTDARVTGIAPGTALITVTTEDGNLTATSTVTVSPASPTATPRTGGNTFLVLLASSGLITAGVAFRKNS